ncbi:MAG: outer membrane protein assembly factor BamD [Isosphaeraceae bacterium]
MPPKPIRRIRGGRTGRAPWLLLALLSTACSGCGSTAWNKLRAATDDSLSPSPTAEERADDRNFFARLFWPEKIIRETPEPGSIASFILDKQQGWKMAPAPPDPAAEKEYEAAMELYQQGSLEQAEKAFDKLARNKKLTAVGEDSQFYLAECQFQRKRYVRAHDTYDELIKVYGNGTKHLDKVVKREYEIGKIWLADSDPNARPEDKLPASAVFTGGRPLVDAHGFALKAFEHVRHHDPLGPLADDAALSIAEQHYRDGDYDTAAIYFDELIASHPKSPLVKRAMLSSIDSKMKAYMGPDYDGTGLQQASKSIDKAKTYFPELKVSTEDDPGSLDHTLDLIDDQMAERTFAVGEYYRRAGNVSGARYYFEWVTKKWPKSPWSRKAQDQLEVVARMKERRAQMSKIMTQPGSTDQLGNPMSGASGSNPMTGPGMNMMGGP